MVLFRNILEKTVRISLYRLCHTKKKVLENKPPSKKKLSHPKALALFLKENPEMGGLRQHIPEKYLQLDRKGNAEHLYLICSKTARKIVSYLKPLLNSQSDQIICETNAGLGLIATELLEDGIPLVRLYEPCPEFRKELKDFGDVYPGRVELFTKDVLQLNRYDYMDKQDRGNRVELLLRNVPKRSWSEEPAMIITGSMPTLSFMKYILQSLALQKNIAHYGRMQLLVLMKPKHFAILSASPKDNLCAYQYLTIIFQLFCDYEILDTFPRNVFLPWEPAVSGVLMYRYPANLDPDKLYLVRIDFKKTFPVPTSELLPLYSFVRQFYGRGMKRVIPTIEKWVPGCGLNLILPKLKHTEYFDDIDIFTRFRELTPNQILSIFKEMVNYPSYQGSPFNAMIENELIKLETIETSLAENPPLEKNISEEIEQKFPS